MNDVSLVIRLAADDAERHGDNLKAALTRHVRAQVVVAVREDFSMQALHEWPGVHVVTLRNDDTHSWWPQLQGTLEHPWVAALDAGEWLRRPAASLEQDVAAAIRAAARRVTGSTEEPVLLATRWCDPDIATAYVHHVLHADPGDRARTHAGWVALSAGKVIAEGVDRRAGAMQVQVMLDLPVADPPPWRFAVAVLGRDGIAAESDGMPLRQFDVHSGGLRRHRLEAPVPLRHVPDGTYALGLRLLDEEDNTRGWVRPLRPSTGATACARTVSTSWFDARGRRQLRYLVHPSDTGRRLDVTLQHGTGTRAILRWRRLLLRRDVRHVLHGPGGKRLRLLLLIRLLTMPLFSRRRPFLIGERPGSAEDNGFHLFRHLRKTEPDRPVFFVLDRDAPQYPGLRRLGHLIPHSSWRHKLLMLHAEVLADSHSLKYLLPRDWPAKNYERHLAWRVGSIRVFLQHGIHLSPEALNRRTTGYDIIITSAHEETAALERATGYGNHLVETVLPRFDALVPHESTRTVLMMTTWRRFLPSPMHSPAVEPFEGSAYERFITSVLSSKALQNVLCAHDYRLVVVPHANIADCLAGLEPEHDRIVLDTSHEETVQDRLLDCDVLVTDYSSVHFDVAYMGRPVIYAQFDRKEYEAKHAHRSWFNFATDGFGPVVTTVDDLIAELDKTLSRGATRESHYTARAQRFFGAIDRHNTDRVVEAIDDLLDITRSALRS